MNADLLTDVFPGWITPIIGSLWGPAAGIALTAVLLLIILLWYFKRKPRSPRPAKSDTQQTTTVDYEHLLSTVRKQNGKLHCLLLAAGSLNDLPVTVPINLAVRLARTHTCLLIDLDTRRNAVARVFDLSIDPQTTFKIGSYPTDLANLYVWPARNFEMLRHANLKTLIVGASKKYDYILIYAPYLTTLPDRLQVASCAGQAIAFTGQNGSRLRQLLKRCNCRVVEEV